MKILILFLIMLLTSCASQNYKVWKIHENHKMTDNFKIINDAIKRGDIKQVQYKDSCFAIESKYDRLNQESNLDKYIYLNIRNNENYSLNFIEELTYYPTFLSKILQIEYLNEIEVERSHKYLKDNQEETVETYQARSVTKFNQLVNFHKMACVFGNHEVMFSLRIVPDKILYKLQNDALKLRILKDIYNSLEGLRKSIKSKTIRAEQSFYYKENNNYTKATYALNGNLKVSYKINFIKKGAWKISVDLMKSYKLVQLIKRQKPGSLIYQVYHTNYYN